jgi:hypothetical protein
MAGGTFDASVGKVRPGTYINTKSSKTNTSGSNLRGIVVIPLLNHKWGPKGEFITLNASAPDASISKLGFSVYDNDANMKMIKEAFKNATTVIVYIPSAGVKATGAAAPLTVTAKYGGTRGNSIKFTVVANPLGGFDVTVYLGTTVIGEYTGLTTVAQLIAAGNDYVTFSGTGNLVATAGVTLTGGTDVAPTVSDITSFLDSTEKIKFNDLAFPIDPASADAGSLNAALISKIKYFREQVGKYVKAVVANYDTDYEGIIDLTNTVEVDGSALTIQQATAWVAGADAAATYVQSNTYKRYVGATAIVGVKTHEEAVAAIKNGEYFFSYSEEGDVVVEYDINSLVSFTTEKTQDYSKNRVLRVYDTFADTLKLTFPPNKYDNNDTGWNIMEGIGKGIIKEFLDAGAITEVDYDNDFLVDRSKSSGDQTYFNIGIKAVDSSEKLYFTVTTR